LTDKKKKRSNRS